MATASLESQAPVSRVGLQGGRHVLLWIALWVLFEVCKSILFLGQIDAKHMVGPAIFGILMGSAGATLGQRRALTRTGAKLVVYWTVFWAAVHTIYCTTMAAFFFTVTLAMGVRQEKSLQTLTLIVLSSATSGAVIGLIGGAIRAWRPRRAST